MRQSPDLVKTPVSLSTKTGYHVPVLRKEAVECLDIRPDGCYVDATYGGGGHAQAISDSLGDGGKLYVLDKDPEAHRNQISGNCVVKIRANFSRIAEVLHLHKVRKIDGLLADLGVSSHQIDTEERGFSFQSDGPLDMRMDPEQPLSAAHVLKGYPQRRLAQVFAHQGELSRAKKIAHLICRHREHQPIITTQGLKKVLQSVLPPKGRTNKFWAQVFQALRMEVNDEIGELKALLMQSRDLMGRQGRLVVISYHSVEDRLVKRFLKYGQFENEAIKNQYGQESPPFSPMYSKPVQATAEEIGENKRAKSAKMRVGIRN